MGTYSYEAMTVSGAVVRGKMEAVDSNRVVEYLQCLGHIPVIVTLAPKPHVSKGLFRSKREFSIDDIALIVQEISSMLQAGLTLEQALELLVKISTKNDIHLFLKKILEKVRSGASFHEALDEFKDVLPKLTIGLIKAGENGGEKVLTLALERLAEYLKKRAQLHAAITTALIYPLILLITASLSIILILLYVLPQFEPLFQTTTQRIPWTMGMLLWASHVLVDFGVYLGTGFLGFFFIMAYLFRQDRVAYVCDQFILTIPKVGDLLREIETTKFCRTLSLLHSNGLNMAMAIPLVSDTIGNRCIANYVRELGKRICEGKSLSVEMQKKEVLSSLAIQAIRIGEETGRLDAILSDIADILDRDVQRKLDKMTALLTPVITIALGALIAAMVAVILSGILSVNELAG